MGGSPYEYSSRIISHRYSTDFIGNIPFSTASGVRYGELYALHSTQGDRRRISLSPSRRWLIDQGTVKAKNARAFPCLVRLEADSKYFGQYQRCERPGYGDQRSSVSSGIPERPGPVKPSRVYDRIPGGLWVERFPQEINLPQEPK